VPLINGSVNSQTSCHTGDSPLRSSSRLTVTGDTGMIANQRNESRKLDLNRSTEESLELEWSTAAIK
jgi:hypothetical protein